MKLTIVAMLGLGCGATKTTTSTTDQVAPQDAGVQRIYVLAAERPALDLSALYPDATEEARWPLSISSHPVLEPHFAIAAAMAEHGIGWLDLCGRGIQNRHIAGNQDLLEYLRAWCSVMNHDPASALSRLGPLRSTTTPGIASAIAADVADILVDSGGADRAEALLRSNHLVDQAIVDELAASYFEVDRDADAFELNRLAIEMDHRPTDQAKCHRLARGIVVSRGLRRDRLLHELEVASSPRGPDHQPLPADPTCVRLHDELQCWIDMTMCGPYLHHAKAAALLAAYGSWPPAVASERQWMIVAQWAARAMPMTGAETLVVPALELALKTSGCVRDELIAITSLAQGIRHQTNRTLALGTRLEAVIDATDQVRRMVKADCLRALAHLSGAP